MEGFAAAAAVTFAVIFLAELGDKSQLMALTFTMRYRAAVVLAGVVLATLATQTFSVAVGHGLGVVAPAGWTTLVAGLAFVGFGVWTYYDARQTHPAVPVEEGAAAPERGSRGQGRLAILRLPVLAIAGMIFLAELGDKTMLATITLAAQYGWQATWIGSVLGMISADALAVVIGRWLGRRVPTRVIGYVAAALFLAVGLWLVADGAMQLR